jgi:putative SOS response-associated peptidase YedK
VHRADEQLLSEGPGRLALCDFASGGEVFGVAGIWENWRDPLTSTWERTFAVITVPANELIAPIHDRMLAILPTEQFPRWLGDEADPRDLLVPYPADRFAVSPQPPRQKFGRLSR